MRIEGEIVVNEAESLVGKLRSRLWGPSWPTLAVLAIIIAGGAAFATLMGMVMRNWNWWGGFAFGAFITLGFTTPTLKYLEKRRERRRLVLFGGTIALPAAYEITPEALVWRESRVTQTAGWPAVFELFPLGGYWVFVVQGAPWLAPKRFFPDAAAERAFVDEALAYMSPKARKRSVEATSFAGEGGTGGPSPQLQPKTDQEAP